MPYWIRIVAGAAIGYLIGSFAPAYVLGRLLKGIDIRTVNYCSAGTRNVKKTLGLWPAVVTAFIDTTKGVASMLVATALLEVNGYGLIAPAMFSVIGHIFPFYLRFRGGRGVATAVGIFIYIVGAGIAAGQFPYLVFVGLVVGAGLIYLVSRSGDATSLFAFLAMAIISVAEFGFSAPGTIAFIMSSYVFLHAVLRGRDVDLYVLPDRTNFLGWRVIARPLALLFVPLHVVLPGPYFLGLLSVLSGSALALDAYRVVTRRKMSRIYRKKESRQLSSITLFLVSTLLLFVVFQPTTAYIALAFLSIGDLSGKLIGMRFGRKELLAGRTLEGSVGFVVGATVAGYGLARVFGGPALLVVLGGAAGAAVIELLTMGFDDNITVGLGSAGLITLLLLI